MALVLGILAIRDLKKHPEKHGMGRAVFGLVMGILFSALGHCPRGLGACRPQGMTAAWR